MFQLAKAVRQIFYLNMGIYLIGILLQLGGFPFYENFALFPYGSENFSFYQFITHMFLHGGFLHILLNMLAFLSFGPFVEYYFGTKKFIAFYLICGLGSAILHMLVVNSEAPMVGASGAIFGVMTVFAILNPNEKLYLYFIIGVKAKYIIFAILLLEVYLGLFSKGDGVAHMAHIGGALTGIILLGLDKFLPTTKKKRWT